MNDDDTMDFRGMRSALLYDDMRGFRDRRAALPQETIMVIKETSQGWSFRCEMGNIKPKDNAVAAPFWLGVTEHTMIQITAKVFGDTIPDPPTIELSIDFNADPQYLTHEELVRMADRYKRDV